ncbi:MAG: 4-(cytidine 5'-diphospho)-2-C-methyl-D-erythritol kinase [Chitinophagaceae bacterium]
MIVFPNCKINLGLRILRKRGDSYHDLETIFYPLPFFDALEIIPAAEKTITFTTSGLTTETGANNLCIKAYELLKKDFPGLPVAKIHLHKTIPSGAGLGGGSADAAFTLRLLNDKFTLGLSQDQLIKYALQLGSDCPFFIINKPCFATGRGEVLEETVVDLSSYNIVIVNPGIHISTANAFAGITPAVPAKSVKEIIQQPVETWEDELINDFETPVFTQYPEIQEIKQELYNKGAVYASLSGSGSTVYGIFKKGNPVQLAFPANYFVKQLLS